MSAIYHDFKTSAYPQARVCAFDDSGQPWVIVEVCREAQFELPGDTKTVAMLRQIADELERAITKHTETSTPLFPVEKAS